MIAMVLPLSIFGSASAAAKNFAMVVISLAMVSRVESREPKSFANGSHFVFIASPHIEWSDSLAVKVHILRRIDGIVLNRQKAGAIPTSQGIELNRNRAKVADR